MRDPVLFAILFFLLFLTLEWTAARKLERLKQAANEDARPAFAASIGPVIDRKNLDGATALRQKCNNSGEILMWVPLPLLGLLPWMVFFSWSPNLIYQYWVHTERIGKLPRPI